MDELWCDIDFEGSYLNCLVDYELEEKLVDALEMGPGRVNFVLCLDTSVRHLQVRLFDVG